MNPLNTKDILEELKKYEPETMQPHLPVIWDTAKDYTVIDIEGNKYIDMTSSIFVTNTGHRSIVKDLIKQAKKCIHSYTFPTKIRLEAMRKLHDFLPSFCEKIYLASAGSEVTSWAINLMRAARPDKPLVISLEGAFHGKTGSAGAMENEEIKLKWPETDEDIEKTIEFLRTNHAEDKCCGIMIESYRGWSASFLPSKYVQILVDYCKVHNIIVCFDEIQAGFWRTGKKFAYEWYEVEPDLLCLGKALGGGFPVSALVGKEEIFKYANHMSSTHSANPLACASIVSVINAFNNMNMQDYYFKSNLMSSILNMIEYLSLNNVKVKYKGMVAALIFKNKEVADIISEALLANGILVVNTGKESIKLGPPLTISKDALKKALYKIKDIVFEVLQCVEK